ncbi:MAG: PAS domain-containing protein [Panacagrimonas sp.]
MNGQTSPSFDPQESEERLRFALDAAHLGQWDLDLRTGRAHRTLRHDQIFGYAELLPEWTFDLFLEHVLPEERDAVDESFRRAFKGSGVWEVQCRIRRADGQVRRIWTRARIQRDASATVIRMIGIVGDETERRRLEQSLIESDARLRLLDAVGEATRNAHDPQNVMAITTRLLSQHLHATRSAYADVDPDHLGFTIRGDWAEEGVNSSTGAYSLALFGSRAVAELGRGETLVIHDVDRELSPQDGADMFNAIGVKAIICCPLVEDDGLRAMMAVHSAIPRAWTRDEVALVEAVVERSWAHIERVRAQARLREREAFLDDLIQTVPAFLWAATAEGEIKYTSRWLHVFTGLGSDQMQARHWRLFVHPDDLPELERKWATAVASGQPYLNHARFRRADGVYRWLALRADPAMDGNGRVLGWYALGVDVHEHKETLDALAGSESALRDADRRKDEFLATLAHELRNPLAPIRNGLHLLRMAAGDPAVTHRALAMMERQFGQLTRLVDDLLDVSRATLGIVELNRQPVSVVAVLDSAVETSRPLIDQFGVELIVSLPGEPLMIEADITRLTQVFGNLLNNAAKFSRRGGRIWLEAGRVDGAVRVAVRDEGIGIAEAMLSRVFELFVQADRSLERNRGGLGIGLTLARRLVEMHGGSIQAHSGGSNTGSEFIVRLPLADPAAAAIPPRPRGSGSGALRILVADDNADAADGLALMLGLLGHELSVVYDGAQALALAREFRPDVVLLDIGMPLLNGLDTARQLRAEPWGAAMSLIALSGWGQDEDKSRSLDAGFDHHLVKPLDFELLEPLLAKAARAIR